jgi:hypothetical protein
MELGKEKKKKDGYSDLSSAEPYQKGSPAVSE